MSVSVPEPASTAVIILGASDFPFAPQFEPAPQFNNSAVQFRDFILASNGFGLPKQNLLWLFDTDEEQSVVVRDIASFLSKLQESLLAQGSRLCDVIFYYVGHGGFDTGSASTYFLALRQTNTIDSLSSSLAVSSLKRALRESTRDVRHYLILDCCFAAAALAPYLQLSAAAQGMVAQIQDAFPPSGTALLCASGAIIPAKAKRGATFTMFSEALLEVLRSGVATAANRLSLAEVGLAVRALLKSRYGDEAVRPEVHSPEQSQGSVADVPLFPNAERGAGEAITSARSDAPTADLSSTMPKPSTELEGLFREFDDADVPAQIPGYLIWESEWVKIPLEVRKMLKQLEGLENPHVYKIIRTATFLALLVGAWGYLRVALTAMGFYASLDKLEFTVWPALYLNVFFAIMLIALCLYRVRILTRGDRVREKITLRLIRPDSLEWERLSVMSLLRRPRDIIKCDNKAYLARSIFRELKLTVPVCLAALWLFWLTWKPLWNHITE